MKVLGQRLNRALDPQANQGLTCPSGQVMDTERSVFSLFGQYLSDKYLFQLRILPKTLQRVVRTTLGVAKLMFFRRSGIFAVWSGIVAVWSGIFAAEKKHDFWKNNVSMTFCEKTHVFPTLSIVPPPVLQLHVGPAPLPKSSTQWEETA